MDPRAAAPADVIDTSRPHPARMYDFYLGGKDNWAADREAAAQVLAVVPEVRDIARVILSFRVSQGFDLRCPVADSVADGTLAA